MADQVIYSMCCRLPGSASSYRRQREMVDLWLAHLRGPGAFAGRVVLLTNDASFRLDSVEPVLIDRCPPDRTSLFLERVLSYQRLSPGADEAWMQLDVDTLAMRPVAPLFAASGEAALRAAPSDRTPLDAMHARPLMCRAGRAWYGWIRGWRRRRGVSACLTSCSGRQWRRLMGGWARAIREHRNAATPQLGDQSFLNLLYMTGQLAVRPLDAGLVHHVKREADLDADEADAATILHFPMARRLELMTRRAIA